jgi:hypothetical protein
MLLRLFQSFNDIVRHKSFAIPDYQVNCLMSFYKINQYMYVIRHDNIPNNFMSL